MGQAKIGILRANNEPHYFFDLFIFRLAYQDANRQQPKVVRAARSVPYPFGWEHPDTGVVTAIPRYTASVDDALLAWPDELRPTTWNGTAIECCIGALEALRSRLPKVPRFFPTDEYEGTGTR